MTPVLAPPKASILEIFESRQGEGPCVGDPQIFVRFGGCNLVCDYCDTPESIPMRSGPVRELDRVLEQIETLRAGRPNPVVSLTGGEPLAHSAFLEALVPELKARGYRIYLETNGSLPKALEKIVSNCDWVAMDFKPETATGRDLWEAHRWFLEMAGSKVFVKMVLTDKTAEAEFHRGVELLASAAPAAPLILQPATPWGSAGTIPLARLMSWWAWATRRLKDVRVIPQIHRLWGIA
jgi:7-carboxy-7-deazaguanine synthase